MSKKLFKVCIKQAKLHILLQLRSDGELHKHVPVLQK